MVDGARVATCVTDTNGVCLPGNDDRDAVGDLHGASLPRVLRQLLGRPRSSTPASAVTFGSAIEPWAIFSTSSGGALFARTNLGAATAASTRRSGPALLGAFHRYRIDWNADQRGLLRRRRARRESRADGRRPDAAGRRERLQPLRRQRVRRLDADVAVRHAGHVPVARVRRRRPRSIGTAFSGSRDAPAGTSAGDQRAHRQHADARRRPWTAFVPVAAPGPLALHSRYIQYRADMTSSDPEQDAGAGGHHHQHGSCAGRRGRRGRAVPENGSHHVPGVRCRAA